MTYDPHVSSPFASPSITPIAHSPNTKWFINIASITDMKLLPTPSPYRCFPQADISKELLIQVDDGRRIVLRASKDADLERWYFVLSKIWEYQQQLGKFVAAESPQSARYLAAHQQSAQLFQKYLQENYPKEQHEQQQQQQQQQQEQQQQEQHQQQQHQNPPSSPPPMVSPRQSQPLLKTPRESTANPYQIPPPSRISAFMPQGFDWSLHGLGDQDNPPTRPEQQQQQQQPLERQRSQNSRQPPRGSAPSPSGGMVHQRSGCAAADSVEPDKAASIEKWRQSLVMPNLVEGTKDHLGANTSVATVATHHPRDNTSELSGLRTDCRDMESTGEHSSLGRPPFMRSYSHKKREDDPAARPQISHGALHSQETVVQDLTISSAIKLDVVPDKGKDEDEPPLGAIQSNRHARWFTTQISSEDSASVTQGESRTNLAETPHRLLPSEPITPERTSAPFAHNVHPFSAIEPTTRHAQADHRSPDTRGISPSLSNPSLSLHGSSYSHLPIHDPDFVFPKPSATILHDPPSGTHAPASATSYSPPFTVHVPLRQLHGGSTAPTTSAATTVDMSRKYKTIDTSPFSSMIMSNPMPSSSSTRPPEITLSRSLVHPDEMFPLKPSAALPSSVSPTSRRQQQHHPHLPRPPTLSCSASALSSASQAHTSHSSLETRTNMPCPPGDPRKKEGHGGVRGGEGLHFPDVEP
ncbi:MAG: hypothetical protein J3Q66DRAFT_433182 [Benniella sp.]|nr:MAG: hypothetical protein J3Q66DRAFT_433182 [Benniella sp.]